MKKNDLTSLDSHQLQQLKQLLTQRLVDETDNRLDYMDWCAYPEQNEIREAVLTSIYLKTGKSIYVIFGGNRSGKTESGAGIVGEIFKRAEPKRIWCGTISDLSIKVQQKKLSTLIRKQDLEYGEYNEIRGWKNGIIVGKNKSTCHFKTYEQGSGSYQGDKIDLIWLDEEPPWDIFQECIARVTDTGGIILFTFTSLSGFTRLVNFLWDSNSEDVSSTVLTLDMNPFIATERKAAFKRKVDADEYESRIEGRPHMKEGLIYKEFSQKLHRIPRFNYQLNARNDPLNWLILEGIDPHPRVPHHWLRFAYHINTDTLYVVDELKAPKESLYIGDFAKMIHIKRNKIVPLYTQIDTSSMIPDVINKATGEEQEEVHTIRREFYKAGIECVLVTKDNALGIGEVKRRLKVVKTLDGTIKRKPKLYFFDDLAGINWEIVRYSWDSYASARISERNETLNRPKKKNDHFMDIIKYQCIKLLLDYRPIDYEEAGHVELFSGMGY